MTPQEQDTFDELNQISEEFAEQPPKTVTRKRRSDAGILKGPKLVKEPPRAGALTAQQATELKRLGEAMIKTSQRLAEVQRENLQAALEYYNYIDSLTTTN